MSRRAGRSFLLLMGVGVFLELAAAGVALLGLGTMARCYWAWSPGGAHPPFPSVCRSAIIGAGFHLFVPVVILLGLICVTGVLAGVCGVSLVRSVHKADAILGPCLRTPEVLVTAATLGRAEHVELHDDAHPYALCIGMRQPRIVISTGLVERLDLDEVAAVLAHEEVHRRRRAPLRQLMARMTARALFFVPVLDDLLEIHLVEEEIMADRTSTAIIGRRPLALALGKLSSTPTMAGVAGRVRAMPYRVRALQDGSTPLPRLGFTRAVMSGLFLAALVVLLLWMPLAGLR